MDNLSLEVLGELRRNAILLRRSFRGGHGQLTLNVGGQSRMLTILTENPGISQKALADLLHIRPQTLGEQLVKLEASGLIRREANPYDKRVSNLFLTEEGVAAAQGVQEKSDETMTRIFAGLEEAELEQLLALVQKLNAAIESNVDMSEMAPPPPPHHHGHHGPHGPFDHDGPFDPHDRHGHHGPFGPRGPHCHHGHHGPCGPHGPNGPFGPCGHWLPEE